MIDKIMDNYPEEDFLIANGFDSAIEMCMGSVGLRSNTLPKY